MSAIDQARRHGWLPRAGPEHTRAVISIALFVLIYVSQGLGFAKLLVIDERPEVAFEYEGSLSVSGGGGYSASYGGSIASQLAFERARNIESDVEGFDLFLFAGIFLSGRPRWGAKVGVAAGILGLLALVGARLDVERAFDSTRWPIPVDAGLEFGAGFWTGCAALVAVVLWNLIRLRLDRRETVPAGEATGARS